MPDSDALGAVDPDGRVEVSVVLRPRHPLEELATGAEPLSREEFAASFGADQADIQKIEAFARQHGLKVLEASQPRRTVRLAGRAADVATAFGVELTRQRLDDGTEYRAQGGDVQLPAELQPIVEGVFGLDTRPVARRR